MARFWDSSRRVIPAAARMTPQPTPPCFRPWLNRSLVVVACLAAVAALTLQS